MAGGQHAATATNDGGGSAWSAVIALKVHVAPFLCGFQWMKGCLVAGDQLNGDLKKAKDKLTPKTVLTPAQRLERRQSDKAKRLHVEKAKQSELEEIRRRVKQQALMDARRTANRSRKREKKLILIVYCGLES